MPLVQHLISRIHPPAQGIGWRQLCPYERHDLPKDTQCLLSGHRDRHMSIRSIPAEVLSRIFALGHDSKSLCETCREGVRYYRGFHHYCTCPKPWELLLSQVCLFWRTTAASTPSLWSEIPITLNSTPEKLQLYLARSGSCSIGLHMFLHDEAQTGSLSNLSGCMGVLQAVSKRWRELRIMATKPVFPAIMASLVSLQTPALEVLHVTYILTSSGLYDRDHHAVPPTLSLRSASRLRDVRFHCCGIPIITSMPTGTLTSFSVTSVDPCSARVLQHTIGASSSTLTWLDLHFYGPLEPGFGPHWLHLPRLQTLSISGLFYVIPMLQQFYAPALARLHLKIGLHERHSTDSILAMLKLCPHHGRFSSLHSLAVTFESLDHLDVPAVLGERLCDFLHCFPSIERLIYNGPYPFQFIRDFTALHDISGAGPGAARKPLLPRLESLVLLWSSTDEHFVQFQWIAALEALTAARRAAGAPLKCVTWRRIGLGHRDGVLDVRSSIVSLSPRRRMRCCGTELHAMRRRDIQQMVEGEFCE